MQSGDPDVRVEVDVAPERLGRDPHGAPPEERGGLRGIDSGVEPADKFTALVGVPDREVSRGRMGEVQTRWRCHDGRIIDVLLRSISAGCAVIAFRYQNLVLLRNIGTVDILVRSNQGAAGTTNFNVLQAVSITPAPVSA